MSATTTPGSDWREVIPDGEAEVFEGYAKELRALQNRRAKGRAHFRGLHTKAHVGVVGRLEVVAELAPALRTGPFQPGASWPLYARFSNGMHGRQPDGKADLRGFAVKLVGVPGKKIIPGLEDAATQDFLMIQVPALPVRGPHEFMHLVRAGAGSPLLALPRLVSKLGFGGTLRALRGFAKAPRVRSLGTGRFFTAAPIRWGDGAVKLSLRPLVVDDAGAGPAPDGLRQEVVGRLARGPLAWVLEAQRFVDEATTPIEDASVSWPEDRSPWLPVARLELPRQDVASAAGQAVEALVETLSFDPWHALVELRPIGATMRARAAAYRESIFERNAAPEPTTVLAPG